MAISDTGRRWRDGPIDADHPGGAAGGCRRALAFAASQLREKHQEAEAVVRNIHDQLDALDPATRSALWQSAVSLGPLWRVGWVAVGS